MVIERGRLCPATPYDQERLDTYRNGTRVKVKITQERDRPMIRKWWAVIGLCLKHCRTPWSTKEEASEAIKIALNIVNLGKSMSGQWFRYPKSLSDLDDPDLDDAVTRMMDLMHEITGVDPETLNNKTAHADFPSSDGQHSSAHSSSQADEAAPASSSQAGAAPELPMSAEYAPRQAQQRNFI